MKSETIYQVQAYVDGELPASDRSAVESLLETDAEARELCDALQASQDLLRGNELEHPVPETRDFYWSKIEREILREEAAKQPTRADSGRGMAFWLRWLVPVGGVAALLLFTVVSELNQGTGNTSVTARAPGYLEVEHPRDTGSVITFRSNTEGVTVVWISND